MNIDELTKNIKLQFARDLSTAVHHGDTTLDDLLFLINRWCSELELNLTPYNIDWKTAPHDAIGAKITQYWYTSDGETIRNVLHTESRPTTDVEIGQIWEDRLDHYTVRVIELGEDDLGHQSICIKNLNTNKISVVILGNFLTNFARIA